MSTFVFSIIMICLDGLALDMGAENFGAAMTGFGPLFLIAHFI